MKIINGIQLLGITDTALKSYIDNTRDGKLNTYENIQKKLTRAYIMGEPYKISGNIMHVQYGNSNLIVDVSTKTLIGYKTFRGVKRGCIDGVVKEKLGKLLEIKSTRIDSICELSKIHKGIQV